MNLKSLLDFVNNIIVTLCQNMIWNKHNKEAIISN